MAGFSAAEYLKHAEHNELFADYLIHDVLPTNSRFSDWTMVVLFYAALHFTKAAVLHRHKLVADKHVGHTDDKDRHFPGHNDYVTWYFPPEIAAAYKDLYDMALQSRYEDFFRAPDATLNEVKRQRAKLESIKQRCKVMLEEEPD